jgi:hypothetical protein
MSIQTNTSAISPLAELRQSLGEFAARCRAQRWFGALFRVGVAQEIVADVAKDYEFTARESAIAAAEDVAAEKELTAAVTNLEDALTGGLDQSDAGKVVQAIARLRRARVKVRSSAARDHKISEAARA